MASSFPSHVPIWALKGTPLPPTPPAWLGHRTVGCWVKNPSCPGHGVACVDKTRKLRSQGRGRAVGQGWVGAPAGPLPVQPSAVPGLAGYL